LELEGGVSGGALAVQERVQLALGVEPLLALLQFQRDEATQWVAGRQQSEAAQKGLLRLDELSLLQQGLPQPPAGKGEPGMEASGLPVAGDGLIQLPLGVQGFA
jgi:hypothetical protein